MENFTRMSEAASPELKDIQTVKILICYLLYRINKPIDSEQLYDIAVGNYKLLFLSGCHRLSHKK